MIRWFRLSLIRQLIGILLLAALASALDYCWAPTPPVRLQPMLVFRGVIAGLLICFVSTILSLSGARGEEDLRVNDRFDFLGLLVLCGVGEEVLFRGYVFNGFLRISVPLAFTIHGALIVGCYYAGWRRWSWLLARLIEASLLALAFYRSRSLALCISAHLLLLIYRRFWMSPVVLRISEMLPKGLLATAGGFRRRSPLPLGRRYDGIST